MAGSVASVIIKIGAQTAEAVAGIHQVDKALGDTRTSGQKLQAGIESAAVPAAVAMTALAGAAIASAKAAAEDQASREQLDGQIRRTTASTEDQIKANEDWIDATSRQVAVADDELRPALAGLVRATGSVTKSHQLMASALDLAAATGKPLAATSAALSKAYTGSYTSLVKLDPALKNVATSGAKFSDVQKELNAQVGGAAKGEAETAAGQYRALQISIHELQESIGLALLPALQAVLPVITNFFAAAQGHTNLIVALGGAVAAVAGAILLANAALKVYRATLIAYNVAVRLVAVASRVWTVAQIALNIVLADNPIGAVVLVVVALAAAIVLAYRHSATFRGVVQSAFSAARANIVLLLGPIGLLIRAFQLIYQNSATVRQVVTGTWDAIYNAIQRVIDQIGSLISAIGRIHFPHIPDLNPFSHAAGLAMPATAGAYASASPYSSAPVYNITVSGAVDPESTARAIRSALERSDRRRGRGFQTLQPWTPTRP